MRVLVTGAAGFIGRRAVEKLAGAQVGEVIALARREGGGFPRGVKAAYVDLLDAAAVRELIDDVRPTHLLHFAWLVEPGRFWNSPENLNGMAATLSLMSAFVHAGGARFVGVGSGAEYDWTTGARRFAEDAPIRPATLYGKIKDATHRVLADAGREFGVSVAWGRVFWLYGPNEAPGRLVSDVARALVRAETVETSEGRQRRDFLHVDDVAAAFVAALGSARSGAFNVGSGRAVEVRRVVEDISEILGRPDLVRFGARPGAANEPSVIEADITVLAHELQFVPQISLSDGLRDTAHWWRSNILR